MWSDTSGWHLNFSDSQHTTKAYWKYFSTAIFHSIKVTQRLAKLALY